VSPRAVLDTVVKRKIPSHRQESNHRTQKIILKWILKRYDLRIWTGLNFYDGIQRGFVVKTVLKLQVP
jgi:hypothetical protein